VANFSCSTTTQYLQETMFTPLYVYCCTDIQAMKSQKMIIVVWHWHYYCTTDYSIDICVSKYLAELSKTDAGSWAARPPHYYSNDRAEVDGMHDKQ